MNEVIDIVVKEYNSKEPIDNNPYSEYIPYNYMVSFFEKSSVEAVKGDRLGRLAREPNSELPPNAKARKVSVSATVTAAAPHGIAKIPAKQTQVTQLPASTGDKRRRNGTIKAINLPSAAIPTGTLQVAAPPTATTGTAAPPTATTGTAAPPTATTGTVVPPTARVGFLSTIDNEEDKEEDSMGGGSWQTRKRNQRKQKKTRKEKR